VLALIFAPARVQQAVGAPDAFQGAVAEGTIKIADEATSAEGGELLAQGDDLLFDGRRSFG